jgi:hypothetical protein
MRANQNLEKLRIYGHSGVDVSTKTAKLESNPNFRQLFPCLTRVTCGSIRP